ncbi:hypothetical protein [Lysinibacillus yapensis]|uniref:hypothetical protein n=1 Tax=Ureibacillus yapensis TaxID=2304605 RepID=UPI0011C43169|nr:hypothetical protein [Lysinibacillus yapensis]
MDEFQAEIEEANDLLRSLGSQPDNNNRRQLQLHLLELSGMIVLAEVLCECDFHENVEEISLSEEEMQLDEETHDDDLFKIKEDDCEMVRSIWLEGKLATAGRDFVQLNQVGSTVFIPFKKLLNIKKHAHTEGVESEPEFIDADKHLRRQLAFNFGEFVSKHPDFINLFFGIFLFRQLKQFVGEDILIFSNEGKMKGLLTEVEENHVTILNKCEKQQVNLNDICYFKVFDLK